jgi:hypothetical protein
LNSPLQVSNKDIAALDAGQLVQLLCQLVYLELSTNQIESYDSQVPLSIYIGDGGIDGWACWADGPEKTVKFPCRAVGFQSKATTISAAGCATEVKNRDGTLKSEVRRVFELGGAYVLFLGRDCVQRSKIPRIKAIKDAVAEASVVNGGTVLEAENVFIYDASDIASWTNTYPAAIASVFYCLNKAGAGALCWRELSGYPDFENAFVGGDERRSQALESLRTSATEERGITRLMGMPGLGKSRLVFEAFRPPIDPNLAPEQATLANSFCYLSAASTDDTEDIVKAWRRSKRIGTVVVDDCPLDLHEALSNEVRHAESRLSLITIGNDLDQSAYAGTSTRLLKIEPVNAELIQALLDATFPTLSLETRTFIAHEWAQGFPQMAIRVAEARLGNEPPSARLSQKVLTGLLGREIASGSNAEKVIAACALFERVGVDGEAAHEREFVRSTFCPEVSSDDFYGELREFQRSGALTRYGRIVQVRPRPLAVRLAADWWDRCSPERATDIVRVPFPPTLAEAFCERLRMLDFVPSLVGITQNLCGKSGPFGQAEVLSSELGSQLFRAIVEVNPASAATALDSAFGEWTTDQLRQLKGAARRNIVWALEKLAFREQTFLKAAQFLSRLAGAENETWSNNSTGVLAQLFMVLLSGTQAPLSTRLDLLRQMARSHDMEVRSIALTALDSALTTDNFSGTTGAESQGSSGPMPEYRPKVWSEVFTYWRSCLEELASIAESSDETGDRAAEIVASHIRGLVSHGRLDDVEWAIESVICSLRKRGAVWAHAVDAVKDVLKYEIDQAPPGTDVRVQTWLQKLEPTEPAQKLRLVVTEAPYEHAERKDGNWEDVAASSAERLGREWGEHWRDVVHLLPPLLEDSQRQGYAFGQGLARGSEMAPELYGAILLQLSDVPFDRRNCSLLSGWLFVVAQSDSAACDSLFSGLAADPLLAESLPSVARGLPLNDLRVATLLELARAARIKPIHLVGLSYGQAMTDVSLGQVAALNEVLLQQGTDGAWVALDILFMYSHGRPELAEALRPQFSAILLMVGMLSSVGAKRASHEFEVVANRLIPQSPEIARFLTEELCSAAIADTRLPSHLSETLFKSLFEAHPEVTWPIVRRYLGSKNRSVSWKVGIAMGGLARAGSKSRPIDCLDIGYLRNWCVEEPETAPPLVSRIVKVLDAVDDKQWQISPAALMLIDDYAHVDGVLSGLGASMNSFSWSGSLVPFYGKLIHALSPLVQHPRAEVRTWAQRQIEAATARKADEAQRDEEQQAGRW